MFIIYSKSPDIDMWDYDSTMKANSPEVLFQLIQLIKFVDGFCDEYQLLTMLSRDRVYRGVNIRIFWEEETYGIWN